MKISQALAERNKSNSGWQRDLPVSYENVGDVRVAQGDLGGALKEYQEYFQIADKLTSQ